MRAVFGKDSVVDMGTGPLSFQRQSSGSLTGNSAFGYHGFLMGARKEYFEAQTYFHTNTEDLRLEFTPNQKSFPVPEPMWPTRAKKEDDKRQFDVILVSDYRRDAEITTEITNSIDEYKKAGLRVGLIQMSRYNFSPTKKINLKIRNTFFKMV
jgi:hypothetical protein